MISEREFTCHLSFQAACMAHAPTPPTITMHLPSTLSERRGLTLLCRGSLWAVLRMSPHSGGSALGLTWSAALGRWLSWSDRSLRPGQQPHPPRELGSPVQMGAWVLGNLVSAQPCKAGRGGAAARHAAEDRLDEPGCQNKHDSFHRCTCLHCRHSHSFCPAAYSSAPVPSICRFVGSADASTGWQASNLRPCHILYKPHVPIFHASHSLCTHAYKLQQVSCGPYAV